MFFHFYTYHLVVYYTMKIPPEVIELIAYQLTFCDATECLGLVNTTTRRTVVNMFCRLKHCGPFFERILCIPDATLLNHHRSVLCRQVSIYIDCIQQQTTLSTKNAILFDMFDFIIMHRIPLCRHEPNSLLNSLIIDKYTEFSTCSNVTDTFHEKYRPFITWLREQ